MTLNQLRTFVAVAESGSIHGAATRLVVSQPAVSASVAALQRDLGVALVAREGRGLAVTPAGRAFADAARRVLGLVEQARVAAVSAERPEAGRLRLAAVTTAGEHLVPGYLRTFRARHPAAEIVLEVGNRRRVLDLLEHREADLVIGGRPPAGGGLVSLATRRNPLVVVSAITRPRRSRPLRVSVGELAGAVWLLREPGSGTRATTEELFEELGIAPRTLTLGSNGAILQSARAGLGVWIL
jgi:DNA-binding transcriptional LysR family regulator